MGIPNGIRVIIVIGEVNGIIERMVANEEFGSDTTDIDNTSPNIMGTTTIDCSCPASWMLSTADPIAAYIAA